MGERRVRVLVVEDEETMRSAVAMVLEDAGYDVTQVADAIAATRVLGEADVDVVVSDVGLPHMSGIELAAALRRSRPGIAIVLMTASPTSQDAVRAYALGTFGYLAKPLDINELLAAVRAASAAVAM